MTTLREKEKLQSLFRTADQKAPIYIPKRQKLDEFKSAGDFKQYKLGEYITPRQRFRVNATSMSSYPKASKKNEDLWDKLNPAVTGYRAKPFVSTRVAYPMINTLNQSANPELVARFLKYLGSKDITATPENKPDDGDVTSSGQDLKTPNVNDPSKNTTRRPPRFVPPLLPPQSPNPAFIALQQQNQWNQQAQNQQAPNLQQNPPKSSTIEVTLPSFARKTIKNDLGNVDPNASSAQTKKIFGLRNKDTYKKTPSVPGQAPNATGNVSGNDSGNETRNETENKLLDVSYENVAKILIDAGLIPTLVKMATVYMNYQQDANYLNLPFVDYVRDQAQDINNQPIIAGAIGQVGLNVLGGVAAEAVNFPALGILGDLIFNDEGKFEIDNVLYQGIGLALQMVVPPEYAAPARAAYQAIRPFVIPLVRPMLNQGAQSLVDVAELVGIMQRDHPIEPLQLAINNVNQPGALDQFVQYFQGNNANNQVSRWIGDIPQGFDVQKVLIPRVGDIKFEGDLPIDYRLPIQIQQMADLEAFAFRSRMTVVDMMRVNEEMIDVMNRVIQDPSIRDRFARLNADAEFEDLRQWLVERGMNDAAKIIGGIPLTNKALEILQAYSSSFLQTAALTVQAATVAGGTHLSGMYAKMAAKDLGERFVSRPLPEYNPTSSSWRCTDIYQRLYSIFGLTNPDWFEGMDMCGANVNIEVPNDMRWF